MQLQFEKQGISCMQTLRRETQTREQTQELRISDGMPDVGRVIGGWGQVILRGKEWQSDSVSVNGGTKVWILYAPEEGGEPQCVESWLPFQMGWDIPDSRHDGVIQAQCFLRSVDARSTSARKLMVRTNVSVTVWAMEEQEQQVYLPTQLPPDIQLRREAYPLELPVEAGEKAFSLEETLSLPPSAPPLQELQHYQLQPRVTEIKMVGDKVVFRGTAGLHIYYKAADGNGYSWDTELPFTQYSELEREYPEGTRVRMLPCVTALEIDREEERYQIKAGIVCQYRVDSRHMVEVVTDAYSPNRELTSVCQELHLPRALETREETVHPQLSMALDGMRLADVQFLPEPVSDGCEESRTLRGRFQVLFCDMDGELHTACQGWEQEHTPERGEEVVLDTVLLPGGSVQGSLLSGSAQLSADMQMITEALSGTPILMVTGLETGELRAPDLNRPSLILRRTETADLWELAKKTGSTETAIREANALQSDPEPGAMLLIPMV